LTGVDDAVAAAGDRAVDVAGVAIDLVAVVAGLADVDDAVAAPGQRAVGLARVAVDGVAVVALLEVERTEAVDVSVAAHVDLAARRAVRVVVVHLARVALLGA